MFWPTSPIQKSRIERSNEKRQGFRSPHIHVSGLAPSLPTNGLSAGTEYGAPPLGFGLMRSTFDSSDPRFWPMLFGSSSLPPSPRPTYNIPSGPVRTWPPLWFENGCSTKSTCRRVDVSTASPRIVYSSTCVLFEGSV